MAILGAGGSVKKLFWSGTRGKAINGTHKLKKKKTSIVTIALDHRTRALDEFYHFILTATSKGGPTVNPILQKRKLSLRLSNLPKVTQLRDCRISIQMQMCLCTKPAC